MKVNEYSEDLLDKVNENIPERSEEIRGVDVCSTKDAVHDSLQEEVGLDCSDDGDGDEVVENMIDAEVNEDVKTMFEGRFLRKLLKLINRLSK